METLLCLACSSSLLPRSPLSNKPGIFITRCCNRPICPSCVTSNPRLTRYDPCLACLGGVAAVDTRSHIITRNVDGAIRDQDTFVLGEDDDEEEDSDPDLPRDSRVSPSVVPNLHEESPSRRDLVLEPDTGTTNSNRDPPRYYIKYNDTLQGLAFRFGVDGRELCRLNNLPPSTLSTTPHLLHTRTWITLPASAWGKIGQQENEKDRDSRRARERAAKRLQMLTKEVDWRVAKAYVALADDPEEVAEYEMKRKEGHKFTNGLNGLEMTAIDRYLEDNEWEERERRAGRGVVHKHVLYSMKSRESC